LKAASKIALLGLVPIALAAMIALLPVARTADDDPAVTNSQPKPESPAQLPASLPKGRNASFADPAYQARFKEWLTKKGFEYQVVSARGNEYVVWEEGAGDLVQRFSKDLAAPCPRRKKSC
jgi:hypothetical protein